MSERTGRERRGPLRILLVEDDPAHAELIRRAYSLRANSYLVKPLDPERFRALLRNLGLFWMVWSELPRFPMSPAGT